MRVRSSGQADMKKAGAFEKEGSGFAFRNSKARDVEIASRNPAAAERREFERTSQESHAFTIGRKAKRE